MSRALSLTMRMAANAEATGEVIVALVTVTHDDLDEPLRFSSDPTELVSTDPVRYATTSRGETFDFLPMTLGLPTEAEETEPQIQIVLDNVTRDMIPIIRSVTSPPQVTVELVLASAPDEVEALWPDFDLVNATYDASQVTLDLKVNALTAERFPVGSYTPSGFGGLF
jgi:hypothetical protein